MFQIDFIKGALLLIVISVLFPYIKKNKETPCWKFSKGDLIKKLANGKKNPPELTYLLFFAFLFFGAAFLNPRITKLVQNENEGQGRALFLLVDRSGSMQEKLEGEINVSKLKAATDIAKEIADTLGNEDWVGLGAFARGLQLLSPLTQDKKFIEKRLAFLAEQKNVTKEDQGTSLGYALWQAVELLSLLAEKLNIQSSIFMITDGFQSPNPEDLTTLRAFDPEKAAEIARQKGIRLYLVNIEPRFATEELAPARRRLEDIAKTTGGEFFLASNAASLKHIKKSISALEKTRVPISSWREEDVLQFSFYFILLGLFSISVFILGDTLLFRKVP